MKKRLTALVLVAVLGLCFSACVEGIENRGKAFYVTHILFSFSGEQGAYFEANRADDEMFDDRAVFEEFALTIERITINPEYNPEYDCDFHNDNGGGFCTFEGDGVCPAIQYVIKYLFGRETNGVFVPGIYEEIQQALTGLSGQAALTVFESYLEIYNEDPGIVYNFDEGYRIPAGGVDSPYIRSFTELSLALYNKDNPVFSVGNAFVDGKLAYCFSEYGVHFIMIKSV